MNTELNKNIKKLIENLGITPYEFSKQIGNKRADNVYNVINNKVEVSATTLNKIFKQYPNYKDFILTGNNSIFKDVEIQIPKNDPKAITAAPDAPITQQMLDLLKGQLEAKDKQLEAKDKRIAELTDVLLQSKKARPADAQSPAAKQAGAGRKQKIR
jgi:hypothetical protein